jgi:hypothetical protein
MKLRNLGPTLGFCCVCTWQLAAAAPAVAQAVAGVTEKEIAIGSCSALEGPSQRPGQTNSGRRQGLLLPNKR